jgi:hypothetical protein
MASLFKYKNVFVVIMHKMRYIGNTQELPENGKIGVNV